VTHLSSVHKRLPSFTSLRSTWQLYSKAIQQFREKKENVDRFLLGFKREFAGPASNLVLVKSRYVDLYKERWLRSTSAHKVTSKPANHQVSISKHMSMRWNDNPDEKGNNVHLIFGETHAPNILYRRQPGSAVMLPMERVRKIFFEESDGNEEINGGPRVGQILRLLQIQRLVLEGSNLLLCEDTCARD
jgi:hypothetical protein